MKRSLQVVLVSTALFVSTGIEAKQNIGDDLETIEIVVDEEHEKLIVQNTNEFYYRLMNTQGSIVRQGTFIKDIDFSGLKPGEYWIKIGDEIHTVVKK